MTKKLLFLFAILMLSLSIPSFAVTPEEIFGRWIVSDRYMDIPEELKDFVDEDDVFTARIGAWLVLNDDFTANALEYDPETGEEYEINFKWELTNDVIKALDIDRPDYRSWEYEISKPSDDSLQLKTFALIGMAYITYTRDTSNTGICEADNSIDVYDLRGTRIYSGKMSEFNKTSLTPRQIYIMHSNGEVFKYMR